MQTLREHQSQQGGQFDADCPVPLCYGNKAIALEAARTGVALCDRSHQGILQVSGADRLKFVHNQTTNKIQGLGPGQCVETIFVNSVGRTLDLVSAWTLPDSIWLLVSGERQAFLFQWMDKYIFPFDQVELTDLSKQFVRFVLLGSRTAELLNKLGITLAEPDQHIETEIAAVPVRLSASTDLGLPGATLIVPVGEAATAVWMRLQQLGTVPLGEQEWEQLRIQQGRPRPDRELTEDYNPLEAGLWRAVSFDKGCYIGQETIARVNTYRGVKTRLWGVQLNQPVELGTPVLVNGKKSGRVTSSLSDPALALAYVRTRAANVGDIVQIGDVEGELIATPYVQHEYYQPKQP
ncbi:MAG: folate-binding protein [Cyanobacteria bacterium P01_H01_bin.15]